MSTAGRYPESDYKSDAKLPLDGVRSASPNKGLEGIAYDAHAEQLYTIVEKSPMRVLRIDLRSGELHEPFDAQAALSAYATDLAGLAFVPRTRTLLVLSQEARCIVQASLDGTVLGTPLAIGGAQPEGIALAPDEQALYVIGEPNEIFEYRSD